MITIKEALARIASAPHEHPTLSPRNRVLRFQMSAIGDGAFALHCDVIDDRGGATGATLPIRDGLMWWTAIQRVTQGDDVPKIAGELVEQIVRKLLETA